MEDKLQEILDQILKFAEANPDCYVNTIEQCIKNMDGIQRVKIGIILSSHDESSQ